MLPTWVHIQGNLQKAQNIDVLLPENIPELSDDWIEICV